MTNWYCGTIKIKGNIIPFQKWVINKLLKNEELDNFAQNFCPLSSGKWDFGTACNEWGVKWDFKISDVSGLDEEDQIFKCTFMSAWNSPYYLWKNIEDKYNVEIEEYGFEEGESCFYKYNKGRENYKKIEDSWFEDKFDFKPSIEAIKDEDIYEEELSDHKNENWSEAFYMWHTILDKDDKNWKEVKLP
tara:strand:- start:12871 stop:13437 length:567 start_codon:yes stop_codon:yes gene_type:complete